MDVRVIVTKNRLQEGLLNLLSNKPFSECSVNEIIKYAEVSKRTFYTYYKDKYDLLHKMEANLITNLKKTLLADREVLIKLDHIPNSKEIGELAGLAFDQTISYCDDNREAFARLLSQNGDIHFYNRLLSLGYHEFDMRFPFLFREGHELVESSLTLDFIRNIYVHGIIDTLILWVKNNQLVSIDDVKHILGLAQTKSPIELIGLYKVELKIIKKRNLLL